MHTHTSPVRRRFVTMLLMFAAVAVSVPGSAAQDASPGPPWEDLERAQADLDAHLEALAEARRALRQAIGTQESLEADQLLADTSDADIVSALEAARGRARQLAIEAYIHVGSPSSIDYLIRADEAIQLAFRHSLLRAHADATLEASRDYVDLRTVTAADLVEIAEEMDRLQSVTEQRGLDIASLERGTAAFEHVVEIARIHALADEAFADTRRPDPVDEQWENLRQCESTGSYSVNTGNGFYGAYQFTWDTWATVGGAGNPAAAPPEEQDARARLLFAERGAQPWPRCGRFLP